MHRLDRTADSVLFYSLMQFSTHRPNYISQPKKCNLVLVFVWCAHQHTHRQRVRIITSRARQYQWTHKGVGAAEDKSLFCVPLADAAYPLQPCQQTLHTSPHSLGLALTVCLTFSGILIFLLCISCLTVLCMPSLTVACPPSCVVILVTSLSLWISFYCFFFSYPDITVL